MPFFLRSEERTSDLTMKSAVEDRLALCSFSIWFRAGLALSVL
jgi:hypothetical protein